MRAAPAAHPDREVSGTTWKQLQRFLSGDLDLIVLKALQKEPDRRYTSAAHFADDIDRFLEGRPVRAHRGGRLYRASKFIGRHPAAVAVGLLGLVLLSLGLIGMRVNLTRALRERDRAENGFRTALTAIDGLSSRILEGHPFDAPGLEAVRTPLLERTLSYYEDFLDQRGRHPEFAEDAAEAQTKIAEATRLIGHPDEAVLQFELAVARHEELVKRQPEAVRHTDRLIEVLTDLGELLSTIEGRGEDALHSFERARGPDRAGRRGTASIGGATPGAGQGDGRYRRDRTPDGTGPTRRRLRCGGRSS